MADFDAAESMCRQLAHGIRVLTLQTGGIAESIPAEFRADIEPDLVEQALTGRSATPEDVGRRRPHPSVLDQVRSRVNT